MAKKVQLCNVMQGVQFTVNDDGQVLKAVILKEALERHFGASAEPDDWIRAYRQHQALIDEAALVLHHLQPIWPVVVLRGHEPQLQSSLYLTGSSAL
ncbi:DUF1488 family protein [Aquabacterium sp.]|uniref:DUF1488 family protein n=1 Tax=Aquabacterium sp. TaxID=1872578 RepID=UPI003D6D2788